MMSRTLGIVESRTECPSKEQLCDLLEGRLQGLLSLESLESHVSECLQCQLKLDAMTEPDAFEFDTGDQRVVWEKAVAEPRCPTIVPGCATDDNAWHFISGQVHPGQQAKAVAPEIQGYQILGQIGAGGMGTVFRARHYKLGRDVAIKVIRREQDAHLTARFEREMLTLGQIAHPNVVRAFDAGESNGIHYLIMELLQGRDLDELMKWYSPASRNEDAPLSITKVLRFMREAALGLQALHEKDLIHRDIKPSNLFLTSEGSIKLLDLGLSNYCSPAPNDGAITGELTVLGSLDYMAPEQGRDPSSADSRSDIYSLGCAFFAMLSGTAPFSGRQSRAASQKLLAHACDPRPKVRDLNPGVPERISKLIESMMSIDAADRPQSAAEVAHLIEVSSKRADSIPFNKWAIAATAFS
ncbi:MAG: serine/threonine-protein kinase, partial [Planctomycetota bacterium]